jgi:thiol-disulfide isomerase/thioredoxin
LSIAAVKAAWQRFRERKALSLLFDVTVIVAVFLSIHAWQTRQLPLDEPAPPTLLERLDGSGFANAVQVGKPGIVYFFAPWCTVCKTSIDNLDDLVREGDIAWGSAIALDYGSEAAVRDFVADTGVTLPVLMGHAGTAADWSIRAYPTYYVIDSAGDISSRSVGYSTWLGMRARAAFADF